jgi:hypothetical protein
MKILVYDETDAAPEDSPTKLLKAFLGTNWAEINPSWNQIVLSDSYWTGSGTASIKFKELSTRPLPLTTGWRKWSYRSTIRLFLSGWFEAGGKYPTVIERITNEIERLTQTDPNSMTSYGISAIWISNFETLIGNPDKNSYKANIANSAITVEFIASKTVKEI